MSSGIIGYRCHAVHLDRWDMDVTIVITDDRQVYFPVRQVCKGLGVASASQLEMLRADERYAGAILTLTIPTNGGPQELLCLPKRECAWWMANIDPKRVKATAREHLADVQADLWSRADQLMFGDMSGLSPDVRAALARPLRGELHFGCPRCGAALCFVGDQDGIHLRINE